MRICQWPILIAATLSILMVGCAEVPLLMDAAMMKSPSTPEATKEDKRSEAEKESEKLADARRLLEMVRGQSLFQQSSSSAFYQTVASIKKLQPDIPEKYLVVIEDEVKRVIQEGMTIDGGLLDALASLYGKHFTHEEIKEMIAFYQTDAGEKAIRVSPVLMQEVQQTTVRWGAALDPVIQQRVIDRLKAEGVELKE
jgi:hypothetical protein